MSILDLYNDINGQKNDEQISHADLKRSRAEIILQAKKNQRFDVIIAGGGIQGAAFARLAAFNGLKVLLLEASDYGSGTSGRTSKMAHGGLRYLEYFDFKQVKEGVRAREELYQIAPHLVFPYPFIIPVFKGEIFKRIKMALGLFFYDLFLKKKENKHCWQKVQKETANIFPAGKELDGSFRFFDGIMHDVRLVLENIYAARQEGAVCLNYARIDSVYQNQNDTEVAWTDLLTHEKYTSRAGSVVNTAGAWAPLMGRLTHDKRMPAVRYSQGTHLLFNLKWDKPAVLVSLPGKGRNYFIWPHYGGTMVGTTEKELSNPAFDPLPSEEEVKEILCRIERDLPGAGLNKENLYYAFAGIRTLPSSGGAGQTFKLSRRHIWSYSQGVLSLLGGKFTSAGWTAYEGMCRLFRQAGITRKVVPLKDRLLPGAFNFNYEVKSFREQCKQKNVPQDIVDGCVRRLGARVRILTELDSDYKVLAGEILEADIKYALYYEQAETISDLFSRRFDLEFLPGNGLNILDQLCAFLKSEKPETDWEGQAESYREYVLKVTALLK